MSQQNNPHFDNNDFFNVVQQNELVDADLNQNQGGLFQKGLFNESNVDQGIDSGNNHQDNASSIFDDGLGHGFGIGVDDNDTYSVFQGNQLDDSDENFNDASLFGAGLFNATGVEQDIDSGDNDQDNESGIEAIAGGGWHGNNNGFGVSGNDQYDVEQTNFMIDTDSNANVASSNQLGFAQFAEFDQDIDSGNNSQNNESWIGDHGASGFGYDDNDAFQVSQASLMADADQNANLFESGQLGGMNGGWFDQDITSGGNAQENVSEIWDTGA
jgi:hypothetical protein